MIKEGIILYNIELNGCLNGVYTNEDKTVVGEVYNEISRLKMTSQLGLDGVSGRYDCFYFDLNNFRVEAELEITLISGNMYEFYWWNLHGKKIFQGIGYKMNERQVAAHYWSV